MTSAERAANPEALEEELAAVRKHLAAHPEDPAANARAGWLLGHLGRFDEAVEHLSRAAEADPENAQVWYFLGMAAARTGAEETVRRARERYEELAPETALCLGRRANLARQAGDPAAGAEFAERALTLPTDDDTRSWVHRMAAASYEALKDDEARLRHLEQAVVLTPEKSWVLAEIAHLQFRRGLPVSVLPAAESAVSVQPDDGEAWYTLGAVANRAGDYPRAKVALETARELGYSERDCRRELGAALVELGDYRTAIAHLAAALEDKIDTSTRLWILQNLGLATAKTGEHTRSLECYRAAVELDPSDRHAQQGLGATYAQVNDFEAALPHLEEAARLAPESPEPWYTLGLALARTGDLPRAEEALNRAIELRHPGGRAQAQLAWVFQRQGQRAAAAREAAKALRKPLPKSWRGWVASILNESRTGRRR
ncbi:MAG: tetratricopeptide repeat protein [Armatimonadota bacterium]